jgi:uncharacterized heparinase superfamily protein
LFEQSIFENNRVYFLNEDGLVNSAKAWNSTFHEKLWLYNLHYFDDLSSIGSENREHMQYEFICRWIAENPPCLGNGWEPYPLSLRLVNWVKWFSRKDSVDQVYLNSIAQQADALMQQLEYHILGNHLFANAKALTFVGAYLRGYESKAFLNLGLELLDEQIAEQFLADGAHFELSPMYHAILLWDLLELIDLGYTSNNPRLLSRLAHWRSVAERALRWLSCMLHPDGEICFFNDSAIGIAPEPARIFEYAKSLGLLFDKPTGILASNKVSGYSKVQTDQYTLFFDHANVGPDYLPGHAHADTLSFEMSVGDQRVFVNSGTSVYGVSAERLRQRGTAAHNTVTIQAQNSSEVWSGFRVARRAYTELIKANETLNTVVLSASHNGYCRLKPKITHTRTIYCSTNTCKIIDDLSSVAEACFALHIHPDISVNIVDPSTLMLKLPCKIEVIFTSSIPHVVLDSTWHPEFGRTIDNKKILIPFVGDTIATKIEIKQD